MVFKIKPFCTCKSRCTNLCLHFFSWKHIDKSSYWLPCRCQVESFYFSYSCVWSHLPHNNTTQWVSSIPVRVFVGTLIIKTPVEQTLTAAQQRPVSLTPVLYRLLTNQEAEGSWCHWSIYRRVELKPPPYCVRLMSTKAKSNLKSNLTPRCSLNICSY